jgi:hypothetical protein
MKTFIHHLIQNHLDEIVEKSILNCHCVGLHSIMLLDHPEKTIRVYIAEPRNELYRNSPASVNNGMEMSIGFHPHHCNLTLECIKGSVTNWIISESIDSIGQPSLRLNKYLYKSKITDGELKFETVEKGVLVFDKKIETLFPKGRIFMNAWDIHTVYCDTNSLSAWIVYEGKEDPNYKPLCWSTALELNKKNDSGLYQKPTKEQVIDLILKVL